MQKKSWHPLSTVQQSSSAIDPSTHSSFQSENENVSLSTIIIDKSPELPKSIPQQPGVQNNAVKSKTLPYSKKLRLSGQLASIFLKSKTRRRKTNKTAGQVIRLFALWFRKPIKLQDKSLGCLLFYYNSSGKLPCTSIQGRVPVQLYKFISIWYLISTWENWWVFSGPTPTDMQTH